MRVNDFRRLVVLRLAALAIFSATAAPAVAQHLPEPASVALPEEAGALRDLTRWLASNRGDADAALASLDHVLAQLRQPTPLRGIVQTLRGTILRHKDPSAPALDAAEEAARLLPNSTVPLLLSAYIEAYRDNGGGAAAYLLRAANLNPRSLAQIDDYELDNILSRLPSEGHRPIRERLIRRLFEVGWRGQSVVLRSRVAREAFAARVAAGDRAGAKALIPQLVNPVDVYELLTLRSVEPLWPDLESWAGPRQENLWRLHLVELRSRWRSSGDHQKGRDYIYALRAANHHAQVAADFLPLFASPDAEKDYDLLWVAAPLADSLAQLGRWDEADALLTRLIGTWPVGTDANALNLIANRGRLRHERGDHARGIADLSAAISDGHNREGEVSSSALTPMHRAVACALHQLKRDAEAIPSSEFVLSQGSAVASARMHLCFDRAEAARDSLIAGLEKETERESVIDFLQIPNQPPLSSELERRLAERRRALQQDQQLLAAVAPHGRILPYRKAAGAPPEAPAKSAP